MAFLSRLVHYSFDAVLVSAILAGVKRTTGYTPDPSQLPLTGDSTAASVFSRYLGVGESIFDYTAAAAHTSKYFKREGSMTMGEGLESIAKKVREQEKKGNGNWWGSSPK